MINLATADHSYITMKYKDHKLNS